MLPEVTLQDLSRDDIDRIAWWLEDSELASRWFGHYGCGDPVHRAYDPQHMLEASDREWERVFSDPYRLVKSIYSDAGAHIGECQLLLDGHGGAEISLLIGRKTLWHHGYGTATVMELLESVFTELGLEKAWVNVPKDNTPALGLFEKLGFVMEDTRDLCTRPDGSVLTACILAINAPTYLARRGLRDRKHGMTPVVAITGLAGSGALALGREVARISGSRLVDEEITASMGQRLRCSRDELQGFEAGFRSFWSRLISAVALPTEWSATYDAGYQWYAGRPIPGYSDLLEGQITRKQYLQALSGVVKGLATEGNVVLHGNGSHLFVPRKTGVLTVFVSASAESRQRAIAAEQGLDRESDAATWLKSADKEFVSHYRHLLDTDVLDTSQYDLNLNMERLSIGVAAEIVAGAVTVESVGAPQEVEAIAALVA